MNIKKYYTGLILGIAMVLASCESVIDVKPEFVKDGSQIYTTLDDYEFALTGTYALFRQTGYYGNGAQTTGSWSTLPDMMADNLAQTTEDLANFAALTDWVFIPSEDDISVTWLAAYSVIAQANLTLRNLDQFAAASPKRVNRIKGQALAIRAMAHFDVLRLWGVNFDRNSTALGVPYMTSVDIEAKPARLTVKETYDKIFEDMGTAETLLGDVDKAINSSSNKSYIDQLAVRALLARINLYAKDYAKSESYATLVIDVLPLASKTAFPSIWKDASVAEVIWSVPYSAGEGSPSINLHIGSSNRNRYRPSTTVEALYDKVNDIRYSSYIASRATGTGAAIITDPATTVTRRIVNKHMGRLTAIDNLVNWKVLRTGEMYLIRAEARALQTGKEALALVDLNTLRASRINGYTNIVGLTGQPLIDAIAAERRRELFAEGHRWFDLKRTTRSVVRTDCGFAKTCTLLPAAREWVWPIPQGEIDANDNIKPQQTPGY